MSLYEELLPYVHPDDKKDPEVMAVMASHHYYSIYRDLAALVQPTSILEIGVRYGYSGIAMLMGAGREAKFVGIDREFWKNSNAWAMTGLRSFTDGPVELFDTDTRISDTLSMHGNFQLAHIDGDHASQFAIHDLDLVDEVLDADGTIIVDDMIMPELYQTCLTWAGKRHYEVRLIQSLQGTLVITKTQVRQVLV